MKSKYACNFRFFQNNIDEFLSKYPTYFAYLPTRIMNNCILLPIEAESQDTALRIFSTLNDRGKPLSDADIFKAQFYKHFSKLGKKEEFIEMVEKFLDEANMNQNAVISTEALEYSGCKYSDKCSYNHKKDDKHRHDGIVGKDVEIVFRRHIGRIKLQVADESLDCTVCVHSRYHRQ